MEWRLQLSINLLRCAASSENNTDYETHSAAYVCICVCIFMNTHAHPFLCLCEVFKPKLWPFVCSLQWGGFAGPLGQTETIGFYGWARKQVGFIIS